MTDTKHSAEREAFEKSRPPRTDLAIKRGKYSNPVVQKCWETWQTRAAIAAAAPVGEPVAYCAPNAKGLPEFGKGWMFSPVPQLMATMPLYAAPVPAAAPKAALTDAEIDKIWDEHIVDLYGASGISPVVFARRILAASGPNAALVEALQLLLNCDKNNSFGSRVHAVNKATAALAAAGVKP